MQPEPEPPGRLGWLVLLLLTQALTALATRLAHGGLLLWRERLRRRAWPPPSDCLPRGALFWGPLALSAGLAAAAAARFGLRCLPGLDAAPLLVAAGAAAALAMGLPPACRLSAAAGSAAVTANGAAWGYVFGYLRLMSGEFRISSRLRRHCRQHGLPLASARLFLLVPSHGRYPPSPDELGAGVTPVAPPAGQLENFSRAVGGARRSFGAHRLYRVAAGGAAAVVALEPIAVLASLDRMRRLSDAALAPGDGSAEVDQFVAMLAAVVDTDEELRRDVALVVYGPGDDVAAAVLEKLRQCQELDGPAASPAGTSEAGGTSEFEVTSGIGVTFETEATAEAGARLRRNGVSVGSQRALLLSEEHM